MADPVTGAVIGVVTETAGKLIDVAIDNLPIKVNDRLFNAINLDRPYKGAPTNPITIKLPGNTSSYNPEVYKAVGGTIAAVEKHSAYFGPNEWNAIARNNNLLTALGPVYDADGKNIIAIEPAAYPAFRFKKRKTPLGLLVPVNTVPTDPDATTTSIAINTAPAAPAAPANATAPTTAPAKETTPTNTNELAAAIAAATDDTLIDARIPNYHVDDQSIVTFVETKNSLQASMIESSFSDLDIKLAVSGGVPLIATVGASFGLGMSNSTATAIDTSSNLKRMYLVFKFPRVMVDLDEDSLELTPECASDLGEATNGPAIQKFLKKYGLIFTTRAQLGGRLYAYEETTDTSTTAASDQKNSMKINANASFNVGFAVAGKLSLDYAKGDAKSGAAAVGVYQSNITWQANGGDTLLCNNPAAWSPTVGSYHNWRICTQDRVMSLPRLISRVIGNPDLESDWEYLGFWADPLNAPETFCLDIDTNPVKYLTESLSLTNGQNIYDMKAVQSGFQPTQQDKQNLDGIGAAASYLMLPNNFSASSTSRGFTFILESIGGNKVTINSAKYNTPYRIKNVKGGNYMQFYADSDTGIQMPIPDSPTFRVTAAFTFQDAALPKTTGMIPSGREVYLIALPKGKTETVPLSASRGVKTAELLSFANPVSGRSSLKLRFRREIPYSGWTA